MPPAAAPLQLRTSADQAHADNVPPPTSLAVMQAIGAQRYAVPAEELTEEALLAAFVDNISSNTATRQDEVGMDDVSSSA